MKDDTIKALVAMICLTAIVIVALNLGFDHFVLAVGCIAIAGLGGYELKVIMDRLKKKD